MTRVEVAPPPIRDQPVPADHATAASSLRVLFAGLVLYTAFGKGFAYAGLPPVFIGEVLLVIVIAGALRTTAHVPRNAAALLAAALVGLAAVQFAVDRFVGADPLIESLRGVATIYYAAFAFGVFALLRQLEGHVGREAVVRLVESAFDRVAPFVTIVVAGLAALLVTQPTWVPAWPVSGAPMLLSKSTDLAVALTILLPVLVAAARDPGRMSPRLLLALWLVAAVLVAFRSRGALLGLVVGGLAVQPRPVRALKALLAVVVVMTALYITGISFDVAGREVSFTAAVDSTASILGNPPSDEIGDNYVGTKEWRSEWWSAIWADVTTKPMVLHGYGWGDNLAVRYGVVAPSVTTGPHVLRAPHSIFFSLAGRAGLVVAVGFMAVFACTVVPTFRPSGLTSRSVALQAARGGFVAALVTALTDVYLESPQGAILFWSLAGLLWWGTSAPVGDEPVPVGAERWER
jgi:hypothetical protein